MNSNIKPLITVFNNDDKILDIRHKTPKINIIIFIGLCEN